MYLFYNYHILNIESYQKGGLQMRSADILNKVYYAIYDKTIDYTNFDERRNIQKTAYILQQMGLPIGNYGFRWYKYGPFSQGVQEDAYLIWATKPQIISLSFSEQASNMLEQFKCYLAENPGVYSITYWLEAIASIHFLLTNIMPNSTNEKVINELKSRKPYLNDSPSNNCALNIVEKLMGRK